MGLQLKKAARKRAKLKIGMSAPSGGGKTLGSLLLAYGIVKGEQPELTSSEIWEKIAIIDSENGSGELYVGREVSGILIGSYGCITLTPPFTADIYIQAIKLCEEAGMSVCIIDSTSQLWAGQGGLLEKQGNIAKRTGNSYSAWRDVTPELNRFVDTMLQTDMHIIATMRSKTEYVQEKDSNGKVSVRKVGLAPVQRDGMEYEFTMFLDLDATHQAFASKDRTGIVDGQYFTITPDLGTKISKWLDSGVPEETKQVIIKSAENPAKEETIDSVLENIKSVFSEKMNSGISKDVLYGIVEANTNGNKNFLTIKNIDTARTVLKELSEVK